MIKKYKQVKETPRDQRWIGTVFVCIKDDGKTDCIQTNGTFYGTCSMNKKEILKMVEKGLLEEHDEFMNEYLEDL